VKIKHCKKVSFRANTPVNPNTELYIGIKNKSGLGFDGNPINDVTPTSITTIINGTE
jgi:hypothetical protein